MKQTKGEVIKERQNKRWHLWSRKQQQQQQQQPE